MREVFSLSITFKKRKRKTVHALAQQREFLAGRTHTGEQVSPCPFFESAGLNDEQLLYEFDRSSRPWKKKTVLSARRSKKGPRTTIA
jgi:hypothetical protein